MTDTDAALVRLIEALQRRHYRFVTPTPASHARVIARPGHDRASDLRGALGWSLPFQAGDIDAEIFDLLDAAGMLEHDAGLLRSKLRVSSLKDRLYLHSAYPTDAEDSVFFGPDSYRFANLIEAELERRNLVPGGVVVDIGTGSGVGAIVAAGMCPGATMWMTDVNSHALRLARINADAAGVAVRPVESDDLAQIEGPIDLALANPPYIIDDGERTYRDGGDLFGGRVSLDMAEMAAARLAPGGRLVLYTGSAIVGGEDVLRGPLEALAAARDCELRYRELDPDVFGEELARDAYAEVDRIAVVAAIFTRR